MRLSELAPKSPRGTLAVNQTEPPTAPMGGRDAAKKILIDEIGEESS